MEWMANNKEYLNGCQKKGWTKEIKRNFQIRKKNGLSNKKM